MRNMIDCTRANFKTSLFANASMAAGYDTGSPDVRWTNTEWNAVANKVHVHIDQGWTGSPVMTSNVRDVEANAWTPKNAVNKTGWNAPRPTIYAARSDMTSVINYGWTGDVWLAWPLSSAPSRDVVLASYPYLKNANLVAVQWKFAATYDESVVYDDYWPEKKQEVIDMPLTYPNIPGNWTVGPYIVFDANGDIWAWGLGTNFLPYYTVSRDGGQTFSGPRIMQ